MSFLFALALASQTFAGSGSPLLLDVGAETVWLGDEDAPSGGISARHEDGWYTRLAALAIGVRDESQERVLQDEGSTRIDATIGYEHEIFTVSLSAQDLSSTEMNLRAAVAIFF